MAKQSTLYFYPKRVLWLGGIGLFVGFVLAIPFLILLNKTDPFFFSLRDKKEKEKAVAPLSFSLGLSEKVPVLPMPDLRAEMIFSFDLPRPGEQVKGERLLVRMKRSGETKRVELPCRLDLEYQRDKLVFAKTSSSFFIELALKANGQVEVQGEAGTFLLSVQECPIHSPVELQEGSPFRILADARWWGRDQFQDSGERVEIVAGEFFDLKEDDWLVWKDQKWQKFKEPEKNLAVAHIQSSGKNLILEGWDLDRYTRIAINSGMAPPFRIKVEELFGSIRIRSEKMISCMLEKQCMILKAGDWVFKSGGRWKILRKKEDRESFVSGKLVGELFVFEQITQKQGHKMIQGRLFNPARTQVVPVEVAAQTSRKVREKGLRKGGLS